MIEIDTSLQKQIVSEMDKACVGLDDAVAALNRVKTHNDWKCKEREIINSNIENSKRSVKRLQSHGEGYCRVLHEAADELENRESSMISSMFNIDTTIADILSVVSKVTPTYVLKDVNVIDALVKWMNLNTVTDTGMTDTGMTDIGIIKPDISIVKFIKKSK